MTALGIVFSTLSLAVLANGLILLIVSRDLPIDMRAAARHWQAGTLLFAAGYMSFALWNTPPHPAAIIASNGFVLVGLASCYRALRSFYGLPVHARAWLPAALAMTYIVADVSAAYYNFKLRVLAFSAAFLCYACLAMAVLWRQSRHDAALSPRILIGIFAITACFTLIRMLAFAMADLTTGFTMLDSQSWLNIATPFCMPMLLVTGTTAFLLMFSDRLQRQLKQAASTDYLTGMPNRRAFTAVGEGCFAKASATGQPFAVALLDIDHFKKINDTYGHNAGDRALEHVAAQLRSQTRGNDVIARVGGEEFAVILAGESAEEAIAVIERLRLAVQQAAFYVDAVRVPITVSAGLAVLHRNDRDFEQILQAADEALYGAKRSGRNRVMQNTRPMPAPLDSIGAS